MSEIDPLVVSYSHLAKLPREKDALRMLKQIASLVKPVMRARKWKVGELAEYFPEQANLLGLNYDRGRKICLRLRYPGDRTQFLPLEEVVDTMLHELTHNVIGPHNAEFHALWNHLRDDYEGLRMKGYTGEGFLSNGQRLGGKRIPMSEARRLARASAEKCKVTKAGSGQRLGGAAPKGDIRRVIAKAADRRARSLQGCANDKHKDEEIQEIVETATRNGFKTQAEEDAANEAAIAQALWELVQEENNRPSHIGNVPVSVSGTEKSSGSNDTQTPNFLDRSTTGKSQQKEAQPLNNSTDTRNLPAPRYWSCDICTLENPVEFLSCDACGTERPATKITQTTGRSAKGDREPEIIDLTRSSESTSQRKAKASVLAAAEIPRPAYWTCSFCARQMEHVWWTCATCGKMKTSS